MKKIIITATVMCLSICLWAQGNKGITASRLAEGDLLFCVAESGNNITDVTTGLDGRQIDHVAIYHNAGGRDLPLKPYTRECVSLLSTASWRDVM